MRSPLRLPLEQLPGHRRVHARRAVFLTDWILGCFAGSKSIAKARYRAFVAEGDPDSLGARIQGERLGGRALLTERFGHDPPLAEVPRAQTEPLPPTLSEIFAGDQHAPVSTAYRRHGYTLRAIGEHLGCHYSTVSRLLRQEEAMRDCKT
jgi:putative transposase